MFLTGCNTVPPLGYNNRSPCIEFIESGFLPTVSTCSLCMRMPLTFPTDFDRFKVDRFKEVMNMAILDSQGFFGQL